MPGFDSLASEIAGGYENTPTEDTVENREQKPKPGTTKPTPGTTTQTTNANTNTTTSSDTTAPAPAPLPFGFTNPEDAATGVPAGGCDNFPPLGGSSASPTGTSCCQQCTLAVQQENVRREAVCSTMKSRVETWFYENGCPIQIIPLASDTSQQQSGGCGCPVQSNTCSYAPAYTPTYTTPVQPSYQQPATTCANGVCPFAR